MSEFKQCLQECMQNDPPACGAACPFGFDIRDFIAKIKRGAFSSAYRAYMNAVAFPGIVSKFCDQPCKEACVFSSCGGSIALRDLEAAALKYTPNPLPNSYNMKARPEKIVIIGGGMSGLACALRMATRKYQVILYEKTDRLGGHLWDIAPADSFVPEIERQFMYENVDFQFNTTIEDLSSLDAAAIYIATGAGGADFGLKLSGTGATASDRPGVFMGGSMVGRTLSAAIADGLTAAKAIDRYLKTGGMNEPFDASASRMSLSPHLLKETTPVVPADGVEFTKEEAIAEAKRCLECRCDACVRYCDLMRVHHKYPRRIEDEVSITIEPVSLSRNARVATRLISTCTHCDLCKEVCPKSIDTGAYLLESHQKMVEKDAMPWVYHEFFLRDMAFSTGEASLCLPPKSGEKANYLFFPGCRLGGSNPRAVQEAYRFLLSKDSATALLLSCCGAPAEWAGQVEMHQETVDKLRQAWESLGRPKLVFACMNCQKEFARYIPEAEGCSIYELLDSHLEKLPELQKDFAAAVFDPCASREMPNAQQAVRSLAEKAGLKLEQLPMERRLAQCCGWGGHVEIAAPKFADDIARDRIDQSAAPYVVYCANCRDIFAKRDKEVVHILDLVFPDEENGPNWAKKTPTATESRENRRMLKRAMLAEYGTEEEQPVAEENKDLPLLIDPTLLEKMDRLYLLREDMEAVVSYCERTGNSLLDPKTDVHVGHMMVGNMTVWVEYLNAEDHRVLVNAYAHRMKIVEDAK